MGNVAHFHLRQNPAVFREESDGAGDFFDHRDIRALDCCENSREKAQEQQAQASSVWPHPWDGHTGETPFSCGLCSMDDNRYGTIHRRKGFRLYGRPTDGATRAKTLSPVDCVQWMIIDMAPSVN